MPALLIVLAAGAASWFTYRRFEPAGLRVWPAVLFRAVAWSALGLLLLDPSRSVRQAGRRPIVLLDASLSMGASGGRWGEARDSAGRWGEVRLFGDGGGEAGGDTLPSFGRSEVGPALRAAAGSGRPVLVVSDGELDDPASLDAGTVAAAGVRTFPREEGRDLAIGRVSAPGRVAAGDTIRVEAEVLARGGAGAGAPDTAVVELRLDGRVLARRRVRADAAVSRVLFPLPTGGLRGEVVLTVALAAPGDREPRDNARLLLVRVIPTPGVVLLADPPDWDARFLYRTLRDVAGLPVRGYLSLERGVWRRFETLEVVSEPEVRRQACAADLLVVKGGGDLARIAGPRARWLWPSGAGGEAVLAGDWYPAAVGDSPLAGALVGAPLDSFPPLTGLTPVEPGSGDWVGLTAQAGRRGAERPVMSGGAGSGGVRREVHTAADGFWRWAFRGGASAEAWRALVASAVSWLLEAPDPAGGRARVVSGGEVVPRGRPVTFEWRGPGEAMPIALTIAPAGDPAAHRAGWADTLRFDGVGRAELRLPPGRYRYRLEGGGEGPLVVDTWSAEWFARPVAVTDRPMPDGTTTGTTSSRQWLWLFAAAVLAFCFEWAVRRRLGLR